MTTGNNMASLVGAKVNALIAESGITKTAISDKTGIPYSTLNSKLHGYTSFTFDDIFHIAALLHKNPIDLLPTEFTESAIQGLAA
jgi:predicted transcriptional regulator